MTPERVNKLIFRIRDSLSELDANPLSCHIQAQFDNTCEYLRRRKMDFVWHITAEMSPAGEVNGADKEPNVIIVDENRDGVESKEPETDPDSFRFDPSVLAAIQL
ncbi:unnamed protein product [Protopolystoma xenopodis]|uniref:Uncharacterized protein n=1 Tax=Protopolystoma xenopodis TaxID=117903 RepID=A0A3S4ZWG5_9PLAT|nr:unnamed protein product [Protopolystoma xenopodis]